MFAVSRTAEHSTGGVEFGVTAPLILSQNEIESVGLSLTGLTFSSHWES
jgi:hypothetical protein